MIVYASLVIASLNAARKPKIVWPLPKVKVEEMPDVKMSGAFLLKKATDIEAYNGRDGWVVVRFADILSDKDPVDNMKELYLMYGCVLPYEVPLMNFYKWRDVEEIQKDETVTNTAKQIVMQTGVKL
jgi:hypothetical protein